MRQNTSDTHNFPDHAPEELDSAEFRAERAGTAASSGFSRETLVVSSGRPPREHDEPVNPPIVLSSTFHGSGAIQPSDRAYGRFTNPTWEEFEQVLASLEGSELPALLFSSGMGAVASVIRQVPVGSVIVMPEHTYLGSMSLVRQMADRGICRLVEVPIEDTEAVIKTLTDQVRSLPQAAAGVAEPYVLFWLESPTNPMLEVADLPKLLAASRTLGVRTAVDNTFATPLVQRPLEWGADYVVHSATKYLAGHSDVVLGAVVTRDADLRQAVLAERSLSGAIPGPFEAWLGLRGLRTLALRLNQSSASAQTLAERLVGHPAVAEVRYPGLPEDRGHERAKTQMNSFGSVLSITLHGDASTAERVVEALRLWTPATSLGGVESLIERRRRHSNEAPSVSESLLRLSVGIEHVEDLWTDLERALDVADAR
ncbi:trans-sulfuration enzyme family protein [Kocuria massiliensis]|uniref:trans-sulfuration enzyme family protein n=1 Tax=Kocuria massiliensis TaxID=1926282 RepID=UPI0022B9710D|nr:PLP-dependent aspartate aminotransferase family protein [Kocuria massiliensis]